MGTLVDVFNNYISWISIPDFNFVNIFQLFLLILILYQIVKRMRETRAWTLSKGLIFIFIFYMFSYIFQLNVFKFIFEKTISIILIGIIIIFTPELRKALETVGKHNFLDNPFDRKIIYNEKFSDKSINEVIEAVKIMSANKTGALMLFEQDYLLKDYEKTGILINADISKQLLINIFEKNTPLHDGALTLKNDRISYATCYLPLSENENISKDLGTRHRAALGASEDKDCIIIIVSEETGAISIAHKGILEHNINEERLLEKLKEAQQKVKINNKSMINKIISRRR